jgi:hypothetical protein
MTGLLLFSVLMRNHWFDGVQTLQAPEDAWMMDMVFSDTGDMHGGFYDNNGGLDYHIPVIGSSLPVKPLHIVHIAVEMAPIAKVCPIIHDLSVTLLYMSYFVVLCQ